MARLIEPFKEKYEPLKISCGEEEGQVDEGQENKKAEDLLIQPMEDDEQE